MHRCLNIVEVQRTIFRVLGPEYGGPNTLVSLACTCKAFSSVALDVLWAAPGSFLRLIQCLPRDLWKIDPMDRKLVFQRPMSLSDWEIFFRYSSRVRHISQSLAYGLLTKCSSLDDDVIFTLSNPPRYGPLIPHLRSLHWDKPNRMYASLLRSLLTPSLVSLSLTNCVLCTPETSILTSLGTVCPSLKNLSIVSYKSAASLDAPGEKILSEALLYLNSLESLTCPAIDEAAIGHLSRLPGLVELSLQLQHDFQLEKLKTYITPPAFASIDSLTLDANALSTLTSLLEHIHFEPRSVSFVVATTPTPDALCLFFVALASACAPDNLCHISLAASSKRERAVPAERVSISTIQPLLALRHINEFEFDVPCDMTLDDDAIATIAGHWPELTTLLLNAKSGWGITPRVTHHGLITLLKGCPSLMDLALSVDFSDIDVPHREIPGTRPGEGVFNRNCMSVNFVSSAIEFPVTIAAFLSDVCPELEEVGSAWSHEMVGTDVDLDDVVVYRERWEEVDNLLPAFSAVRRQCTAWIQKLAKKAASVVAT